MIPYTTERRADTGVTNVRMGVWLFLASETMLFGAFFSAYALLRSSAASWPHGTDVLDVRVGIANVILLGLITLLVGATALKKGGRPALFVMLGTALCLVFAGLQAGEYSSLVTRGLNPSASMFLAIYFTLTGVHLLHVAGGAVALLWILAGWSRNPSGLPGRLQGIALYWGFVWTTWVIIVALTYGS